MNKKIFAKMRALDLTWRALDLQNFLFHLSVLYLCP